MASDSQTATATTSEKPLESKVKEEAKLMEVLQETADVVSDSNLTVMKEEKVNQTPAGEVEKEPSADVEEVVAVVKAEKGTDENGEKKVVEQVELKETTPVKESGEAVDAEKAEGRGKDENGEKVAEQVEIKEPILVKEGVDEVKLETVDVEKEDEKRTVESVAEEDSKDKEETKVVDVSESTEGKQVEQVDVQLVREVPPETVEVKDRDVEVLKEEPKPEASEKVETQPEKANEVAPDVEVVKAEETTEQAKVELEGKLEDSIVETKDSSINSKDEQTVPINQDSDTAPKKETEGDASSPADVIEKAITEEKHVVDEPSKDEKTSESVSVLCPEKVEPTNQDPDTKIEGDVSSPADFTEKAITQEKHVVKEPSKDEQENATEAKDVVTTVATEDENIKKDTETPAAEGKSQETDTTKQEEPTTEKVAAEVVEESEEPNQEPEVTTKEVAVKQKQSNSIMSKVKKSLVKAKKAIIGKSPSSKTIITEESKEDVKVK